LDNLTHSLVGWTLGQAGLKTKSRKGLAALILGANMPDIDVFLGHAPWDPLAIHRGFTHGLFGGVLVMPPILAGLLWLLDRWQVKRGAAFRSGLAMHFGWLVALSYIGTLSHPLLDMCTNGGSGIPLFWPLDDERYFFPWTPIEVSPLGIRRFFSERGLEVLTSEIVWVWLPAAALYALLRWRSGRLRVAS